MSPVACMNRLAKAWQVVAPEWHSGPAGDLDKASGEGGMPLAVVVPEDVGRDDLPGCADQCADRCLTQRHEPWA